MKEYKVSEGFIKEAYEAACNGWKERIKKEFPGVFEANPIIGKWVKGDDSPFMGVILQEEFSETMKGYGVDYLGNWKDELNLYGDDWSCFKLATPEEVKAMLLKEAEKRGYKEGVKLKSMNDWDTDDTFHGCGNFYIESNTLYDSSGYGVIFKEGKWAEIINENNEILERIESLQKELQELKERVK